MAKYSVYQGTFICQKCHAEVHKMRFWRDAFDATWICDCKFVSKVNLYGKGY